jgi:hypothetical protein
LFVRAFGLLCAVRIALWLVPFRLVRRWLEGGGVEESREADAATRNRIGWAVRRTSRFVPGASCLTQALTTRVLLRGAGQPARVRIGVAKSVEGELQAHAWVESGGVIVVGKQPDLARFTPLSPADGEET